MKANSSAASRESQPPTYEYLVCFVQEARVTFINGVWQGKVPIDTSDPQPSLDSCPMKHEFLALIGLEGWELVAVVPLTHLKDQTPLELFLKREKR